MGHLSILEKEVKFQIRVRSLSNTEKGLRYASGPVHHQTIQPFKQTMPTVKSQYKFVLSVETKNLMKTRDQTRKKLSLSNQEERSILLAKYKKLRNEVNRRIRSESRKFNNERIEKANNENEMWQVVNDVLKPRQGSEWRMNINVVITEDEEVILQISNFKFNFPYIYHYKSIHVTERSRRY